MRVKPKEDWTIVEGVNEPIVSEELYELANLNIRIHKVPDYAINQKYPLKGKLRCGNCRHTLSRMVSTYKEYFICSHGQQIDEFSTCCKEQYPVQTMEQIVWRSLKEHIAILQEAGILMEEDANRGIQKAEGIRKDLDAELALLKEQKIRQYESYADGRTTKEAYLKKKDILCEKIEQIEQMIEGKRRILDEAHDRMNTANQLLELTEKYVDSEKITYEAVDAFIQNVYVYDPGHIEIVFRFEDAVKDYLQQMEKVAI